MTGFFSTIPTPQTEPLLQIIPYKGPPNQKPSPRRIPIKKISSSDDDNPITSKISGTASISIANYSTKEAIIHTPKLVQAINPVQADDKVNRKVTDSGSIKSGLNRTSEKEGVLKPVSISQEDVDSQASHTPVPSEGSSRGNAIVVNDSQSDPEADSGNSNSEDLGPHMGDRLENFCKQNLESHDMNFHTSTIDNINSETTLGSKIQAGRLPKGRLQSTPPTSLLTTGTEQPMRKALDCEHSEAAPQQRLTKSKLASRVGLPIIESANSDSDGGSDTGDDGYMEDHPTLPIYKRKRPPPANNSSRKRQSRRLSTLLKPSASYAIPPTRQQKPSSSQKKSVSSHAPDGTFTARVQSSVRDAEISYDDDSSAESSEEIINQDRHVRKRRKPTGSELDSVWCSPWTAEDPSTCAPLHATRKTRLSVQDLSSDQTQWRLSGITFFSLSAHSSILTAIFRGCGRPEILSASHAANLLKNTVSSSTLLEDITLKLVTSDTWFLTGLINHIDEAGRWIGQPVPALPRLQANIASPLDHSQPNDDLVDDTSSINGENDDDDSSNVIDNPPNSKGNSRWSEEDDNHLRKWKEDGKPWKWICSQFSDRSPGAVQTRWYTKLRT